MKDRVCRLIGRVIDGLFAILKSGSVEIRDGIVLNPVRPDPASHSSHGARADY